MKTYSYILTAETNQKGVLDLDPVKGCSYGMQKYKKGCYDCCYAYKIAKYRGFDFSRSIVRHFRSTSQMMNVAREIQQNNLPFIRMGTFGDPSYNWDHTLRIASFVKSCNKKIVIITKHWVEMEREQIEKAGEIGIVLNTSISALDDELERESRLREYQRYKKYGKSILRIVSCDFNKLNENGEKLFKIQENLFKNENIIDNPLRIGKNHNLVKNNVLRIKKVKDLNSEVYMSLWNDSIYTGYCKDCPDLCGAN